MSCLLSQVIKSMHTPHLLLVVCQEIRNKVEFNAPRLSVLGLFGFRKTTTHLDGGSTVNVKTGGSRVGGPDLCALG